MLFLTSPSRKDAVLQKRVLHPFPKISRSVSTDCAKVHDMFALLNKKPLSKILTFVALGSTFKASDSVCVNRGVRKDAVLRDVISRVVPSIGISVSAIDWWW